MRNALLFGMGSLLAMLCFACDSTGNSAEEDRRKFSGVFLHALTTKEELREIVLPGGEVRRRIAFPTDGLASNTYVEGGISNCGAFFLTSLRVPGKGEGVFAVDMDTKKVRFLRDGSWPSCGPNGELFFFYSEPGKGSISLFVAPLDDLSNAKMLIDGRYGLPQPLVFVEGRYMATYNPHTHAQVVFELGSPGVRKVWTGTDCEPLFWRSRTNELVCRDTDMNFRSQKLMSSESKILIDSERHIEGVLHYFPNLDAILTTTIRGDWRFREHQDLIAVELDSLKVTTLLRDVDINVHSFAPVRVP